MVKWTPACQDPFVTLRQTLSSRCGLSCEFENGIKPAEEPGSQHTAWRHTQRLTWLGVRISMADTGQPTQNGLAERLIGILKQEHVDFTEYEDFDDAFDQLKQWLEIEYMNA